MNKVVHFIWIGDSLPKYVNYTIAQVKKLNPDYSIDLIFETPKSIFKSNRKAVQYALQILKDHSNGIQTKYSRYISKYINWHLSFVSVFTDFLRFIILDQEGGIYMDCDVLPVVPFKNMNITGRSAGIKCISYQQYHKNQDFKELELLKNYPSKYSNASLIKYEYFDSYFIAAEKDCWGNSITLDDNDMLQFEQQIGEVQVKNDIENSYLFQKQTEEFKSCMLDIESLDKSKLLYHFCNRKWQNVARKQSICRTLYDDILNVHYIKCNILLNSVADIENAILNCWKLKTHYHFLNVNVVCDAKIVHLMTKLFSKLGVTINETSIFKITIDIRAEHVLSEFDIQMMYDFAFNRNEQCFECNGIVGFRCAWRENCFEKPIQTFHNTISYVSENNLSKAQIFRNIVKCSIDELKQYSIVNLCTVTDKNYLKFAVNMLKSVKSSKNPIVKYNAFIIATEELSDKDYKQVNDLQSSDFSVFVIRYSNLFYAVQYRQYAQHISSSTYVRLLIDQLLPKYIDKVLYLDGDIIIKNDLLELHSLDMHGKTVACALDFPTVLNRHKMPEFFDFLDNSLGDYVNAGVMLIDLKKFRKRKCRQKLYSIYAKRINTRFGDQDIINFAFSDDKMLLDEKYNFQVGIAEEYCKNANIKCPIPVIEHYIGQNKQLLLEQMNSQNAINVCYVTDSKYLKHAICSIKTLIASKYSETSLAINVIGYKLSDDDKQCLANLQQNDAIIKIIDVDDNQFVKKNNEYSKYVTSTTYLRFRIPSLLSDCSKVLYLDCDTEVLGDISELYQTKMENCFVGGVLDLGLVKYADCWDEFQYIKDCFHNWKTEYINAGVLLMDLDQMRQFEFERKCEEAYYANAYDQFIFADQDIINLIATDHKRILQNKYNWQKYCQENMYEEDIRILHHNGKKENA